METGQEKQPAKLREMLAKFSSFFMLTWDNGDTSVRPMSVASREGDSVFWFAASRDSGKVAQVEHRHEVVLLAQEERSFVAAHGLAEILGDRDTIRRLWSEPLRVWFPDGPEDPELVFIRVAVDGGEYWDAAGMNRARYLFRALSAYFRSETPETDDGVLHGRD